MKKALVAAAILPFALSACGGSSDSNATSREKVVEALTDDVILPGYERAAKSSRELEQHVSIACTKPESVKTATDALKRARTDWKHAEAMFLGPVMDKRTDAYVDYKTDAADVERLATTTSPATLDVETVNKRVAADQRGYGALEILLGGPHIATPRGCEYAKSIAKVAADQQQLALDAWRAPQGSTPPYRDTVLKDPTMALDDVVNDSIGVLRAISDLELRAGTGNAKKAGNPTAIKEGPLLDGTAAIRARVESAQSATVGRDMAVGLSPLLTTETTTRLRTAFNDSLKALDEIPASLRVAAQQDKAKVTAAAESLDLIRHILSTEVVSQLGIALGFSDSDGDSSA